MSALPRQRKKLSLAKRLSRPWRFGCRSRRGGTGGSASGTRCVSRERELYGLDLHEHGISAYPEYVISPAGTPRSSKTLR